MNTYPLTYKPFGDAAILVEWPTKMNDSILKEVISFYNKIEAQNTDYIKEVVQSINSLTVIYDPQFVTFDQMLKWLRELDSKSFNTTEQSAHHLWKIPVCYDLQFGIDLKEMAVKNNLSIAKIIELHTQSTYSIYSIGFLPGFLYLGGLDKRLFIDRRSTPRLEVVKGAVGIGGKQTGIYPMACPGGWQIIGNSPISFFNTTSDAPCFAKPGDQIKFYAVTIKDHEEITKSIGNNSFTLEKEVLHD